MLSFPSMCNRWRSDKNIWLLLFIKPCFWGRFLQLALITFLISYITVCMGEDWDLHFQASGCRCSVWKALFAHIQQMEMRDVGRVLINCFKCVVSMRPEGSYYYISCVWKTRWISLTEELYWAPSEATRRCDGTRMEMMNPRLLPCGFKS